MANCISLALFGYDKQYDNCYDFKSYIRYLSLNMRMYKLLFPDWRIHLSLDNETYNSPFKGFFDYHVDSGLIDATQYTRRPLCEMMLFRMSPNFMQTDSGVQRYDRVICRDIDSLPTYRERQAVEYWVKNGKIAHAITDSISHTIPLMGGMVGFKTNELRGALGVSTFDKMLALNTKINFDIKGSDQSFLNEIVLPKVANSITEHYILGMPQSFRGDCFNYIQNEPVTDIPPNFNESNILVNHIGQAGFIMEPVLKFIRTHETEKDKEYFDNIEKQFPEIFYWWL